MDVLRIHGLDIWARVGCTAAERAFPQRLELDVDMDLSLAAAGRSDDLRRSVDYAAVAERVRGALERAVFVLAEAAAEKAAETVLKGFQPVRAVQVRLRKRALPGILFAEVDIQRTRRGGIPRKDF